ncbi:MAG: SRPBCC family protein [Chloroflexota bacterium]
MAKLESSITINRPIEEVFAFVSDMNNSAKYQSGIIEAKMTSDGPVRVGTTYRYVSQIIGQKMETNGEVTAYEPPTLWSWKATKSPFPLQGGMALESVVGGTKVNNWVEAEPGGFFKLAEGLLMKQVQGQLDGDLK